MIKKFEEYKYIKVNPSKDNVKDPNEPFFNWDKKFYKASYEDIKTEYEKFLEETNRLYRKSKLLSSNIDYYDRSELANTIDNYIYCLGKTLESFINLVKKCVQHGLEKKEKRFILSNFNEVRSIIGIAYHTYGESVKEISEIRFKINEMIRQGVFDYVKK